MNYLAKIHKYKALHLKQLKIEKNNLDQYYEIKYNESLQHYKLNENYQPLQQDIDQYKRQWKININKKSKI